MYALKEIFYTLQGEGHHTGRPAIFLRFAGCNLWSGHEKHRLTAVCKFCDTDFVGVDGEGGGKYNTEELIIKIKSLWQDQSTQPFLVCTGGEPAMQMDQLLVDKLHDAGCYISIETNGTLPLPEGLDWITVSPKSSAELVILQGHELKLVYPQNDALPSKFEHLKFQRFSIQPMDGPDSQYNTKISVEYCLAHPQWSLSLQTHKILDIP
ncbi:MAG: 7-carboxy-7-deazaguanine synthase [Saprospiraceae bacterium]|jgi:7-carboxy-7-deazaguanine synthase (Cx14CxxC type)|nr:7-carboxy-7-deazaguanine synthase [Saprospiraceae bacterium]MBK6477866.1 7-carboxy-7-deazaguanine synthase [Saprospiraceae bacterium]MBK6816260.1 7-carboxy-7-deazaguanine synthase [Saprospiraceae bacterium]MBK7370372.1 7-carboxy-7-deazaguanine synthase [Saprospiraceae bacterium]MBK7438080.1 7-carboxy-7-deazaguanine synthase [Saprospiraceae bacterium]